MEGISAWVKITVIGWCVMSINSSFDRDEIEVILSSLKLFKTTNCYLVEEKIDRTTIDVVKKFNENFISAGFVTVDAMTKVMMELNPPDIMTAVVVKVEISALVKQLFVENYPRLYWFIWFLIINDELDETIRIPYNCQLYKIKKDLDGVFRLVEIYHIKNSSAYTNTFGVWKPIEGMTTSSLNMYRRRSDMKGIQLKVQMRKRFIGEETVFEFWRDTAKILNYTLIEEDPELLYDETKVDGTTFMWGIVQGYPSIDWIFFSFGLKVKLIMKFRGSNEVGWRAYAQPFTDGMWVVIGVWLLLSTIAIIIVNGCNGRGIYLNIYTSFFCLCNSDPMVTHPPGATMSISTKLVYLMSLAVPAVIIPAYAAYILSTLSIVLPLEPFHDFKGFIEDGTYKLALVNGTFAVRYFNNSNDPEIKHINNNFLLGPNDRPKTYDELFSFICQDNTLIGLFVDTRPYRSQFQCRTVILHPEVMIITVAIQLPKGSPIRKILNEKFAHYHETGVRSKPRLYLLPTKYQKSIEEEANSLQALNMSQTQTIFLLIPFGVILSLLVLAIEITVKRFTPPVKEPCRKIYID